MMGSRTTVLDACVVINLAVVDRLDLLAAIAGLEFRLPDAAREEVTGVDLRDRVEAAIEAGLLRVEPLVGGRALEIYAELRAVMGKGEAACLALAEVNGWIVASDEKGGFRREAIARLGEGRLVTTAGLMLMAIRAGALTIDEADRLKADLEQHRFKLKFRSFRELLAANTPEGKEK